MCINGPLFSFVFMLYWRISGHSMPVMLVVSQGFSSFALFFPFCAVVAGLGPHDALAASRRLYDARQYRHVRRVLRKTLRRKLYVTAFLRLLALLHAVVFVPCSSFVCLLR
jgi:hypothetical protein